MPADDRSATPSRRRGLTGRRAPAVRALRASEAAAAARRVVARGSAVAREVTAPEHAVRRLTDRASLALHARRGRRAATAGLAALADRAARIPAPVASAATVSVVLLVADGAPAPYLDRLGPALEVITATPTRNGESLAAAAARAAREARGDRVCFVFATSEPLTAGVLTRLGASLDAGAVAASAQLVHPVRSITRATPHDGRVRALGLEIVVEEDAPAPAARAAGEVADPNAPPTSVAGASAACLLVDGAAYAAAGGISDYVDIDVAAFDLCRRLRANGGSVVVVPAAIVLDHRAVGNRRSLTRPVAVGNTAWAKLVDDAGPALLREAAPPGPAQLRIAITVAAPSRKVAPRWGDWHLAQAFADALRRAGHLVRVQTADEADDLAGRSADVHCVVRGLASIRRTRGQRHVLWIISHPEAVEVAELDAADLVLVASDRFAADLQQRTPTPVESFLQATDPHRFHRVPADPAHRHAVTVVAKSRDQYRSSVADAISSGLRPAIYGSGWEKFVDPTLVVSQYVDNTELARVYSSAGVVLNDHWDSMRDWGFVSNRIFDALACGTPVVSDDVPEIAALFDGAVPTFRDGAELRALVDEILADPGAAQARARRGTDIVLARHTFDARAREFLDALARHGLDRPREA